jgi:hypothetical protein
MLTLTYGFLKSGWCLGTGIEQFLLLRESRQDGPGFLFFFFLSFSPLRWRHTLNPRGRNCFTPQAPIVYFLLIDESQWLQAPHRDPQIALFSNSAMHATPTICYLALYACHSVAHVQRSSVHLRPDVVDDPTLRFIKFCQDIFPNHEFRYFNHTSFLYLFKRKISRFIQKKLISFPVFALWIHYEQLRSRYD